LTGIEESGLKLHLDWATAEPLTAEQLREVDEWIEAQLSELPEAVAAFLRLHRHYLTAGRNLPRRFNETLQQLRRALGITSCSERRRSGSPTTAVPGTKPGRAKTEQERLEEQRDRSSRLGYWHEDLHRRHTRRKKRIEERLAKMKTKPAPPVSSKEDQAEPSSPTSLQELIEETPVESSELSPVHRARRPPGGGRGGGPCTHVGHREPDARRGSGHR
jgi:hypothetical protein